MNVIQLIENAELQIWGMSGEGLGAVLLTAIAVTWLSLNKDKWK